MTNAKCNDDFKDKVDAKVDFNDDCCTFWDRPGVSLYTRHGELLPPTLRYVVGRVLIRHHFPVLNLITSWHTTSRPSAGAVRSEHHALTFVEQSSDSHATGSRALLFDLQIRHRPYEPLERTCAQCHRRVVRIDADKSHEA
eukprot:6709813-Prymnesium_polylepis.1